MNKRLVIVGAGGFGREVHSWVNTSPRWRARAGISEIVFVDDEASRVPMRAPIISTVSDYAPGERDVVICAIGAPKVRREVVEVLRSKDAPTTIFVHDRAIIGDNVVLGIGTIVCPGVLVSCDVQIGEYVHINIGSTIGHDVSIGDFVTLSPACNLNGNVTIEGGVFLGTAVSIIPEKRIGASSIVGAGSVVVKNIPADVTAFGNPSVVIGRRLG